VRDTEGVVESPTGSMKVTWSIAKYNQASGFKWSVKAEATRNFHYSRTGDTFTMRGAKRKVKKSMEECRKFWTGEAIGQDPQ
jgi:hypothetical protein